MDSIFSIVTRLLYLGWGKLTSFRRKTELEIKSINFSSVDLTFNIGERNQKTAAYHLTLQQITSPALYNRLNENSSVIILYFKDRQKRLGEIADFHQTIGHDDSQNENS